MRCEGERGKSRVSKPRGETARNLSPCTSYFSPGFSDSSLFHFDTLTENAALDGCGGGMLICVYMCVSHFSRVWTLQFYGP